MKKFAAAIVVLLACAALATTGSPVHAGRLNGPGVSNKVCEAFGSVTYSETFRGGETAEVAIHGDGDTDLDLFVYDPDGRLIAQGIGLTDRELVRFDVPRTATYRIVVRNLGNVWNRFGIATN